MATVENAPLTLLVPDLAPPPDRIYPISVEQYDEMARLGVLGPDDKVELIEGMLVKKMTKETRHLATTWLLQQVLGALVPKGWFLVVESPVVLAHSQPEPDVMIIEGQVSDYFKRKPHPENVALLIEVADTSYAQDRARQAIYAQANIPTYWIVNIPARRVEVHTNPAPAQCPPTYLSREVYTEDSEVPLRIGDTPTTHIQVAQLLPTADA